MAFFRDLFAAATAATIMLMGVTFVVMVMPASAFVLVGVAFVVMVMPAGAFVLMGVTFVVRGSFQYLISSWTTLVELMSIYKRLRSFERELDDKDVQEVTHTLG